MLKALCVLLGVKPAKGAEHWQEARKMMQNASQFMRTLLSFDKDKVRDERGRGRMSSCAQCYHLRNPWVRGAQVDPAVLHRLSPLIQSNKMAEDVLRSLPKALSAGECPSCDAHRE